MNEETRTKLAEIEDHIISDLWQKCDDAATNSAREPDLFRALQRFELFAKGLADLENAR